MTKQQMKDKMMEKARYFGSLEAIYEKRGDKAGKTHVRDMMGQVAGLAQEFFGNDFYDQLQEAFEQARKN